MGEVPAVVEVHGEDGVPQFQHAHIGGQVGGGTAVGLDVHMVIRAKDLPPHLTAVLFQLVHALTAAIVPSPAAGGAFQGGITLRVLIGQAGTHGPEHVLAGEILAGDELDIPILAGLFLCDDVEHLGIHLLSSLSFVCA